MGDVRVRYGVRFRRSEIALGEKEMKGVPREGQRKRSHAEL